MQNYDYYIVAFSGGKDSLACLLSLFEMGIPKEKIELWHHCIDGREGSTLMDWPVTEDYCRKVADAFGVKIYFSWKEGGFEREMNRKDQLTAPIYFEYPNYPDNKIESGWPLNKKYDDIFVAKFGGTTGKPNTRLKFPQVAADLRVRWCSAYLKIDVCVKAITNQPRFVGKKTLILTGERAQESTARANYKDFEPHRADLRNSKKKVRVIDQWRPVHKWDEQKVWDIIEKYNVQPHPAYLLGWGRLSCMTCIFGSANQWSSVRTIAANKLKKIADYEKQFARIENGKEFKGTINRKYSVTEMAELGIPYESITQEIVDLAMSPSYTDSIINPNWKLPAGAFGESTGPT